MKQDTNFSAAWKQVAGSRTTATRQTKQSILNSMLRAFLFLTLMVMGANGAWAQTSLGKAEINGAPGSSTGWQTISDQGNVKAWYNGTTTEFTNGAKEIDSKWFVKLSSDGFIKIRVAKGSVVAGDILRVELADIYQNADNQDLGFKVEGSGSTPSIKETDNAIHTIDYTLKTGDIRVDPDDATYDYIQINRNGQYGFNGCGYHSVEILRNILDASIYMAWSAIDGNSSTETAACTNNLGKGVDAGGTVFGDGGVGYLNYVNVKGGDGAIMPNAKCLIIEGNAGVVVRILFNRKTADGTKANGNMEEEELSIPSSGKLIFDISSYDTFHLNAIKIPYNGSTGNVVNTIKFSNALTTYTVNVNRTDLPGNCDAWFTIGSDPQQYRTAQQVPVGTNVTFTMNSSNEKYVPEGWRTEPWQPHDRGWMGYTASFTTTVRENAEVDDFTGCDHDYSKHEKYVHGNINAAPEFKKTFKVIVRAEQGGTATVSDANGHDMNTPYSNSTGNLAFTATPSAGYTFVGWYNSSDTPISYSLLYNYGPYNSGDGTDLILTAKFASTSLKITYDANGATGTVPVDDNTYTDGSVATVKAPDPSMSYRHPNYSDSYDFGWWDTQADGKGTHYYVYNNGVLDNNTTSITVNSNITLYAIFRTYATFQKHTSNIAVPDGNSGDTFEWSFNVRGDGVASVTLEKKNGSGNWVACDHDNDIWAEINDGNSLPGYGVDRKAVFHNLDKADPDAEYHLVLYQTNGVHYKWSNKTVPVRVKKPVGYNYIDVTHNGVKKEREFLVHIPSGAEGKVPVLFSLHGAGNDYTTGVANYNNLANSEKFIVVYPRGLERDFPIFGANNARGWLANGIYNEDVKFFEEIINYLNTNYSIDTDRIYMTGFSNGGMMTYSTAFTSDKFAGFAAVAGYPLNEFHLQHYGNGEWQGSHPVPFMHIHGKDDTTVPYDKIQPIIDNMVYRNGCYPIPTGGDKKAAATKDPSGGPDGGSKACTVESFAAAAGTNCPFVYYAVDGMGHQAECFINTDDNEYAGWNDASQTIIWNFLSDKRRANMSNYDGRNRIEFKPGVEILGDFAFSHGFKKDLDGEHIILQYGDGDNSGSDDVMPIDGNTAHKRNVHHSIQLGKGYHNFQFKSTTSVANRSTLYVTVLVERLGILGAAADAVNSTYTASYKKVFERDYNIGDISFNINDGDITGSQVGEYRITFKWNNSDQGPDSDTNGKTITISNIQIQNNTASEKGTVHGETQRTDFTGFFNYEDRLIAQWNFDVCDGARFNMTEIEKHSSLWNKSKSGNVITYSYNKATDFEELYYGDTNNTKIPITAGLKFKAQANQVKMQVTVVNDVITKMQLMIDATDDDLVQMRIPYVRNSFRNDKGNVDTPYDWEEAWDVTKQKTETYWNEFSPERFADFKDCIHHINRDIVYFCTNPDIFSAITNKCYDDDTKDLFNTGGNELVRGVPGPDKYWNKCNFLGNQGTKCIVTFKTQTTIDRLGVNRNLISSFYTENIAAATGDMYSAPIPGLRLVGNPTGSKVADVGATYATYNNAIAMTYGGWKYNGYGYLDGDGNNKQDGWGDLTVYHGENQGQGDNNYSVSNFTGIDVTKVPLATDGFPVYTYEENVAYSETVNPSATNDGLSGGLSYHDQSDGGYQLPQEDGGTLAYKDNFTPWTLPCRGAFVKFEPTYPGVVNVHILQNKDEVYYIADEFGRLVKTNVFTKTGTGQDVLLKNSIPGHFYVTKKDNVKYSFNVYPGKTYYVFSNEAGMGVTGYYFEPYVYRKYNALDEVPGEITNADDRYEEYEMARQDVGIKTATMSGGPTYSFTWNTALDNADYTNQTAAYPGGSNMSYKVETRTDHTTPPADNWTWLPNKQFVYNNGERVVTDDFVPTDYPEIKKTTQSAYDASQSSVSPYNPIGYDNKAVHVTLERSFTKNQWSTITLPYSMNSLQLETVFGEGTKVVLLRDVQDKGKNGYECVTANFVYHVNQDIIAGYPYLIYPTKSIDKVEANVYLGTGDNTSAPTPIVISGKGPNIVTYDGLDHDGLACFDFTGNYADKTLKVGSYVVASDGKLTRLPKDQTAAPFRAFLEYDLNKEADHAFHSRPRYIESVNFGELSYELGEIDGIEDILLQSGIVGDKTDVYNINGQKVRQHTDNLQGLKKGLYIVNGRKYIVR